MAIPKREARLPVEAPPKTNLIELNTIAGPSRRPPYAFKADAQLGQARRKPYVFPEVGPEADSPRDVKLFEFLAVAAPTESKEPIRDEPWGSWTDALASADDPEEVSAMLAELLARLDVLAETRRRGQLRMLPRWAPLLPPVCIISALGLGLWALTGLTQAQGLHVFSIAAPLIAGLFAVPLGLLSASVILGGWLRRIAPGTGVRVSDLSGTVLRAGRLGWVLNLGGLGKRRMPYYVMAFAILERGQAQEPRV